jgi:hypothetical protein
MSGFWQRTGVFSGYDLDRLIDFRERSKPKRGTSPVAVICDIDKTYLETKFETVLQLVQTAFQSAAGKQTVAGASDVLLAARWGHLQGVVDHKFPRGLHFVSSSPPQLRSTLDEKLSSDGLDWDSDTFKDQAYNLLKGKLSLLRNHVAYKSLALLRIISSESASPEVFLLGDNAELDPYIYAGVYWYLRGTFTSEQYAQFLALALPEDHPKKELEEALRSIKPAKVKGIFIREAPGYQSIKPNALTQSIVTFNNYFTAALHMIPLGLIEPAALPELCLRFHNDHGFTVDEILQPLAELANHCGQDADIGAAIAASHQLFHGTKRSLNSTPSRALNLAAMQPNDPSPSVLMDAAKQWLHAHEEQRAARKRPPTK